MHSFELRLSENAFELRGGPLEQAMLFPDTTSRTIGHAISFLSQKDGGVLRIVNAAGRVVHVCHFEPVAPVRGSIDGLHAPRVVP